MASCYRSGRVAAGILATAALVPPRPVFLRGGGIIMGAMAKNETQDSQKGAIALSRRPEGRQSEQMVVNYQLLILLLPDSRHRANYATSVAGRQPGFGTVSIPYRDKYHTLRVLIISARCKSSCDDGTAWATGSTPWASASAPGLPEQHRHASCARKRPCPGIASAGLPASAHAC